MDRSRYAACGVFISGTHIQQQGVIIFPDRGHIVPVKLPHLFREQILYSEAGHIDGILGGGKGRCIAKLQLRKVISGHARPDGCGKHVAPFVNTVKAYKLGPKNTPRLLFKQSLNEDVAGSWIISGVRRGIRINFVVIQPAAFATLSFGP